MTKTQIEKNYAGNKCTKIMLYIQKKYDEIHCTNCRTETISSLQ